MLLNIIRWLRGYVIFEVIGQFPERFINVCVHRGYFVFDAHPENKVFIASLLVADYRKIRSIARRAGVRLKVQKRCGLPFLLSGYKERRGLLYGAVAFLFIIIFMQSFIWTVEINGVTTLSVTDVENILAQYGVKPGTFKNNWDLHTVERSIMQDVNEVGWMSINLIGTKAEVEIKEKVLKPDIVEADIPCNIKAKKDGIIVSMNVKKGSSELPVGSAVKKGQLIVSGVVKNALNRISFVHADALVVAQTQNKEIFVCNKKAVGKRLVSKHERTNLDFFGLTVPMFFFTSDGEYTSLIEKYSLYLNNTRIPVGVTEEVCTVFEDFSVIYNKKKAENKLKADEALFRLFVLSDCTDITSKTSFGENEDEYYMEVSYSCLEDIAFHENIIVN